MKEDLREDVVSLLRRRVDLDEYNAIRKLWIAHSLAEDQHDIPGLMATLTDDCVYTVVNSGVSWHGKEGATRFYQQLLTSFDPLWRNLVFARYQHFAGQLYDRSDSMGDLWMYCYPGRCWSHDLERASRTEIKRS